MAPLMENDNSTSKTPEQQAFEQALKDAVTLRMPFGKFGPEGYPPHGLLLCDLPYEYLRCFTRKGFPKGRLGEIMSFVYQLKLDGAENVFKLIRETPRQSLHKPIKRRYDFE